MSLRSMIRQAVAPEMRVASPETSLESSAIAVPQEKPRRQLAPRLENVTEIPEASSYVAGLATRPALAALNGMISSFPVPKIFASNAIPLLMYMRDEEESVQNKADTPKY